MINIGVKTWLEFKDLVRSKKLLPQYEEAPTTWEVYAVEEGVIVWKIAVLKDSSDCTDFLTLKPGYNKPIRSSVKVKMARVKADTVSGIATLSLVVPSDRYISGGSGWFDTHTVGDIVRIEIHHPTYGMVDSFNDESVATENKGWFIPPIGKIDIGTIITDDPAFLPAGLTLKITATKFSGEGTFFANILWGQRV